MLTPTRLNLGLILTWLDLQLGPAQLKAVLFGPSGWANSVWTSVQAESTWWRWM